MIKRTPYIIVFIYEGLWPSMFRSKTLKIDGTSSRVRKKWPDDLCSPASAAFMIILKS
jgi:hypothetical protein